MKPVTLSPKQLILAETYADCALGGTNLAFTQEALQKVMKQRKGSVVLDPDAPQWALYSDNKISFLYCGGEPFCVVRSSTICAVSTSSDKKEVTYELVRDILAAGEDITTQP